MVYQKEIISNLKVLVDKNSKLKCELNHVKKLFKKNYPHSTDITINYSKIIPSIWISHKIKGKTQYTHIRQFLLTRAQAKNPEMLDRIYTHLYGRVHIDYESIIQFAIYKAEDKNLHKIFTWKSVNNMYKYNYNKLMFYCCQFKDKNRTIYGFSIFNRDLVNIEFDSGYIKKFKSELDQEYETYLDLLDDYYPIPKKENQYEKKSQYQAKQPTNKKQNDYYMPKEKQSKPFRQKQKDKDKDLKLNKILNKNLNNYERKLDDMYEEYQKLTYDYDHGRCADEQALDILDEETYEFQNRLSNFKKTIEEIKDNIKKKRNLKGNYKRALIVQKQLDSKLPIIARKEKIMKALKKFDLIILQGETGSGKSTQLPQILCEYFNLFDDQNALPVLITQPRKLAARTLAERVAYELQEKVGGFVDYIDTEAKHESRDAKIIFKLDRIALDDIIEDGSLRNYSCLVLDEAHQRTINIDVIIGLINKLFSKVKENFKVIITSASMDIKLFQDYFQEYGSKVKIQTIKVPGRMYPVKIQYKDYHYIKEPITKIEKVINEEIIPYVDEMKRELEGNILVFCTNVEEINMLVEKYTKKLDSSIFKVLPLHGKLTPQDQAEIFKKMPQFKLIFATRMAETAITIDGVTVVVDPGEDMKKVYNQERKISSMRLLKISQSTAKQRAGRAGRTSKGHCFRLYSQKFLENCPLNQTPQIENQSLEIVVLRLKQLKLKNLSKFQFLSPPSPDGLQISQQLLKMIGCLNNQGELNSIGRLLVKIPIQPFLSRAIAESLIYESVLREKYTREGLVDHFKVADLNRLKNQPISQTVVEILCMIVNSDSLFYSPQQTRQQSDLVKFQKFSQQSGDFFYLKNIYDTFMEISEQTNNEHKVKAFLNKYFLSFKTLRQVKNLNKQIKIIMKKQGDINLKFIGDQIIQKSKIKIGKCKNYQELVLSCLLSSFCANLCLYSQHPQIGYTLLCQKFPIRIYGTSNLTLQGISPKWIVCHNLTQNAFGQIYCKIAHEVKEQFFEKEIIQGYIVQKFEIAKLMESNPFYVMKKYQVSTYIYRKVYEAYLKRRQFAFFSQISQKMEIIFSENNSSFTLFIYLEKGQKEEDEINKFNAFLSNLIKKMDETQRYNYQGNCKVLFKQDFQIYDIEFNIQEYILDITHLNRNLFNIIYCNCYGYGKLEPISHDNIRVYLDEEFTAKSLNDYLRDYKVYGDFQTKVVKIIKNRNNPDQQVLIYFFAGSPSLYQKQQCVVLGGYDYDNVSENRYYLTQALKSASSERGYHYDLDAEIKNISISKSRTMIKLQTYLDEYNIDSILRHLINKNYLSKDFLFPQSIYKNRSPAYPESTYNNDQWKKQIHRCLSKYIKDDDYVLTITEAQHNHKSIYDQERISLCAKLTTQNKQLYNVLYSKLDDQLGVLGCDKIHIRCKFTLLVCTIPLLIYQYYQAKINETASVFKFEGKSFELSYFRNYKNNEETISIYITSHQKNHIFAPLQALKKLFVPRIIKLSKLQAEITKANYREIIQQAKYDTNAQFTFDFKQRIISAYCDDDQINSIESSLRKVLTSKNISSMYVSYKGKNLHKVLDVLKKFQEGLDKDQFFYEILFMKWVINLSGKLNFIQQCSVKIRELNEESNKPCQLCQDIIKTPYTLHNCKHVFCWECLTNIIRQCKNDNERDELVCPYEEKRGQCGVKISYYDVKQLFSDQEFREFCDQKIRYYAEDLKDQYYICKNCSQIFEREHLQRDTSCNFCGSKGSQERE